VIRRTTCSAVAGPGDGAVLHRGRERSFETLTAHGLPSGRVAEVRDRDRGRTCAGAPTPEGGGGGRGERHDSPGGLAVAEVSRWLPRSVGGETTAAAASWAAVPVNHLPRSRTMRDGDCEAPPPRP
jgi:hypothetical protein